MPWTYKMTLVISLLALPLFIYVGSRLAKAMSDCFPKLKNKPVYFLTMMVVWLYIYPLSIIISYENGNLRSFFANHMQLHWQDYFFLYPFWIGFVILLEILPFFILIDLILIVPQFEWIPSLRKWTIIQSYLKIGIVGIIMIYVFFVAYADTNHVRVSNVSVPIARLPQPLKDLKICFIGDIHVDRYTGEDELALLHQKIPGDADLMLCAGDLISTGKRFLPLALKTLCGLKGEIGNVACMGDHDYWYAEGDISKRINRCGWKFLKNRHHVFSYKGYKIVVTGITHIYSKRISTLYLRKVLSRAPQADLKILLVHQPRRFIIDIAAEYGYQLLLAGHTHGGQIVNHIFGYPITPNQLETNFFRGQFIHKKMAVVITNGIGLTMAPIRYHAPAEITRITLAER